MKEKTNSIVASAVTGMIAYMLTDTIHEVIGHGGTCLLIGQHINLLTSAFFRSSPGSFITDLSGPFANLLAGLIIYNILQNRLNGSLLSSYFLLTLMAYNLFWFSGTILQSAFSSHGDWTYTLTKLHVGTMKIPILLIAGILAYILSIKLVRNQLTRLNLHFPEIWLRKSIQYSLLFAALAAIVAALFYNPDRITAAKEGLLEMVASLPILFTRRRNVAETKEVPMKTNWIFYSFVGLVFIGFCFTLGKGIY